MTHRPYEDFADLFAGREDAYGTGHGYVVRNQVTMAHYADHFEARGPGIGIFPVMDGNEVNWACVDIDEPDFAFARQVQQFLPGRSFIERSRSGNAHVWVFFASRCPAWVARGVCRSAMEALGRPQTEVFPKQDTLRPGMLGNFVNLPYYGDERPMLDPDDDLAPMLFDDFAPQAFDELNDPDEWRRRAQLLGIASPAAREITSEFGEQETCHPCAIHIYEQRFDNPLRPGSRAVVIFNLSKQLLNWKALSPDGALEMVTEVNQSAVEPLPEREVNRIFHSALNGRYTSTGCDDPLMLDYILPDCKIASRG